MTEIHDGVFCLRDRNAFVYLVRSGEEGLAIDAGFESTGRMLADALESLGVRRLGRVLLTHGHGDHYEGCGELDRRLGTRASIHAADARLIVETGDAVLYRELDRAYPGLFPVPAELRPSPPAAALLAEGDVVELGERRLRVLHTPGHTEGSLCFLEEARGILFSGDTVSGDFVHFYCEPHALDASLARLEGTSFEHLLMAHPYPPGNTSSLSGDRARAHIARSRDALAAAGRRVSEVLERDPTIAAQALAQELAGPTVISVIRLMEAARRPA
jgi:glyoxylase-like metal-dependent hydrolase (beta-lactamase superfamily II)